MSNAKVAITYVGPFDRVEYPESSVAFESDTAGWAVCARGDSVKVDADVAESLLEQPDNWQPVKTKTTKTTEGED